MTIRDLLQETSTRALAAFGIGDQLIHACRESTELIDAICEMQSAVRGRRRRGLCGPVGDICTAGEKLKIVREAADMALMVAQIQEWAGPEMWAEAVKRSTDRCLIHVREEERANACEYLEVEGQS